MTKNVIIALLLGVAANESIGGTTVAGCGTRTTKSKK